MEILRLVKIRLGIDASDTSRDEMLNACVDAAVAKIRHYCNLTGALPYNLIHVAAEMAAAAAGGTGAAAGAVTSIREGDVQVNYAVGAAAVDNVWSGYLADLNAYRKVRW